MSEKPPIAYRKSIENISEEQNAILKRVLQLTDDEDFFELMHNIDRAALGQLSFNTIRFLIIFRKFKLWRIAKYKQLLHDLLLIDFENAKRSLLGLAREEEFDKKQPKPLTSFQVGGLPFFEKDEGD
ncbi:MAG: hypothetical protein J7L47_04995 [Candidatus Odinarchaeota archaeon]|nr:hypothetical protein [Candidatus Odinarchaeota archaeon]